MDAGAAQPTATIRGALAADLESLVPLVRAYHEFEGIGDWQDARMRGVLGRLLGEPRLGLVLLAEEGRARDAGPVGYATCCFVYSIEHGGLTGVLDELFVRPASRRRGIAAGLVHAAVDALRAAGCVEASLEVAESNATARTLYAHCGFAPRDRYRLMSRRLAPKAPGLPDSPSAISRS